MNEDTGRLDPPERIKSKGEIFEDALREGEQMDECDKLQEEIDELVLINEDLRRELHNLQGLLNYSNQLLGELREGEADGRK